MQRAVEKLPIACIHRQKKDNDITLPVLFFLVICDFSLVICDGFEAFAAVKLLFERFV